MSEEKNLHRLRIGQRIATIRKEKGLSVRQLAELSGVTFQNINKIELGKYSVGIDVLTKITDALDVKFNIVENTIIDKACEWLKEEIRNYISYDREIDKELIDDFKKAMIKAAE